MSVQHACRGREWNDNPLRRAVGSHAAVRLVVGFQTQTMATRARLLTSNPVVRGRICRRVWPAVNVRFPPIPAVTVNEPTLGAPADWSSP